MISFDLEPLEPEMDPVDKAWIDAASYEDLLRKHRFHPISHPLFMGDTGRYFTKILGQRYVEVGAAEATAISKRVGWLKA